MYYKLLNDKLENILIGAIEPSIRKIVGARLNDQEIASVIAAYRDKLLNEVDFNCRDFLYNLEEYVKLLDLEQAPLDPFSNEVLMGADFLAMQKKLFSPQTEAVFLRRAELAVRQVIKDTLPEDLSLEIIKAYQYRLLNEQDFNSERFFLDLKGYLKYFLLEESKFSNEALSKAINSNLVMQYKAWHKSLEINLLHHYGFSPYIYCGSDNGKSIYLDIKKNVIIRFYFAFPSEFLYQKLMGTSQADVSKALANDLIIAKTVNIPGEPMEIIETFLPVDNVDATISKACSNMDIDEQARKNNRVLHREIMGKIKAKIEDNVLSKQIVHSDYNTFGLVVRVDAQGNKKVYTVVSNLEFINQDDITNPQSINKIKQLCADFQPNFLNYDDLAQDIPALRRLVR